MGPNNRWIPSPAFDAYGTKNEPEGMLVTQEAPWGGVGKSNPVLQIRVPHS